MWRIRMVCLVSSEVLQRQIPAWKACRWVVGSDPAFPIPEGLRGPEKQSGFGR
jgi:hypothetical protein